MKVDKVLYFGDLFALPFVVAGFSGVPLAERGFGGLPDWSLSVLCGLFVWTLVEYCVHRFVYHHTPYFASQHNLHHLKPEDLIGFPSFLSIAIIAVVSFYPLHALGSTIAGGFTSGMMVGYGVYVVVHYATHSFALKPGTWLYRARIKHMAHHYHPEGNFGVTTSMWDHVFGTCIARRQRIATH